MTTKRENEKVEFVQKVKLHLAQAHQEAHAAARVFMQNEMTLNCRPLELIGFADVVIGSSRSPFGRALKSLGELGRLTGSDYSVSDFGYRCGVPSFSWTLLTKAARSSEVKSAQESGMQRRSAQVRIHQVQPERA